MADCWYVTFHGGDGAAAWNNIHRFTRDGKHLGSGLDKSTLPPAVRLRELRGFQFGPDGDLYVANAYKDRSQILRFHGAPAAHGKHAFAGIFAERQAENSGLAHPFAVEFGPDRNLYVPSQDTNVVGRYFGPGSAAPGQPMPLPAALAALPADTLHPGTFVPSARHAPTGLREVRHAIFGPDRFLYVADRSANQIKRYDGVTGALDRVYAARHLSTPIHLLWLAADGSVLIGSRDRNAVLKLDPASGEVDVFIAGHGSGLDAPGGLALGGDGDLYVASRSGRAVLRYDAATGAPRHRPLLERLPDRPEFLQLVSPR